MLLGRAVEQEYGPRMLAELRRRVTVSPMGIHHAMLRHTLAALEQLPQACAHFRKHLPPRALPTLGTLEPVLRDRLNPAEAYSMVPGRDPQNG
jgi:hypothetical protein